MDYQTKCSFCDKTFSSSTELSEHLVLCGNKTDQCPTCRRFIRRAIFAYHFENNCANLDENTSNARQMKPTDMVKCEYCKQNVLQEHYEPHKKRCIERPKDSANSNQNQSINQQHRTKEEIVYIPCQFCDKPIEFSNLHNHQETCKPRQNPPVPQNRCRYCNLLVKDMQGQLDHERTCYKKPGGKSYAAAARRYHQPS